MSSFLEQDRKTKNGIQKIMAVLRFMVDPRNLFMFSRTDSSTLDTADKESASALDPLVALEKTTDAKRHVENIQRPRIESLQNVSEQFNADPYSLSLKARKKFREEKKVERVKRKADDALKGRYGLPTSLSLVEEDEKSIKEAKAQWEKAKLVDGEKDPKRRKLPMSEPSSFAPSLKPVDSLRTRLFQNTAKRSASSSLHSSRP